MLKLCLVMLLLVAGRAVSSGQHQVVPLYAGTVPGSEGKNAPEAVRMTPEGEHVFSSIHHPSMTLYLPAAGTATGAGVLVIPGGGHAEIWMDHEGFNVAEWLSRHGVAAFILKYRLAREPGSTYTVEGTELDDVRQAMRVMHQHAAEWGVDRKRLGVIGFSAGGELAALVSTRSGSAETRPAFQALIYPSIPARMELSQQTPPAFLLCGANDDARISEALPELYLRLKRAGIPVEMHVLAGVGHGFGIRRKNAANVSVWPELFYRWLQVSGFVTK